MKPFSAILLGGITALWSACDRLDSAPPDPTDFSVVSVDTLQRFQLMTGWEATAQAGQGEPGFGAWRDELFDRAVNDLGINRLRLSVKAGVENPLDYYIRALTGVAQDPRCERYTTVNDNNDPRVIDPAGFHFSETDSAVVNVVLPMKQRLEARGERLFLNLNYVAFLGQCAVRPAYVHGDPAEYAEVILATFLHLKSKYGLVPDALEVILEPDNVSEWNGTLIGQAVISTAARLAENGFHPEFIAPATTSMANAITYARDMYLVPDVTTLVKELSYHRYAGVSEANLSVLAEMAKAHGARTAMLEHIGSDVEDLYTDLVVGQASTWQQFTLAFGTGDTGGQYYRIINRRPVLGSRTRYLRQYFRYVRMGARRVAAASDNTAIRAVAFRNANGGMVVVMHTEGGARIKLQGLAPGTYGASVTTETATGEELGDQLVRADGTLTLTAPQKGVLTVYRK
jgi:O-glycosyl hydrolase